MLRALLALALMLLVSSCGEGHPGPGSNACGGLQEKCCAYEPLCSGDLFCWSGKVCTPYWPNIDAAVRDARAGDAAAPDAVPLDAGTPDAATVDAGN